MRDVCVTMTPRNASVSGTAADDENVNANQSQNGETSDQETTTIMITKVENSGMSFSCGALILINLNAAGGLFEDT